MENKVNCVALNYVTPNKINYSESKPLSGFEKEWKVLWNAHTVVVGDIQEIHCQKLLQNLISLQCTLQKIVIVSNTFQFSTVDPRPVVRLSWSSFSNWIDEYQQKWMQTRLKFKEANPPSADKTAQSINMMQKQLASQGIVLLMIYDSSVDAKDMETKFSKFFLNSRHYGVHLIRVAHEESSLALLKSRSAHHIIIDPDLRPMSDSVHVRYLPQNIAHTWEEIVIYCRMEKQWIAINCHPATLVAIPIKRETITKPPSQQTSTAASKKYFVDEPSKKECINANEDPLLKYTILLNPVLVDKRLALQKALDAATPAWKRLNKWIRAIATFRDNENIPCQTAYCIDNLTDLQIEVMDDEGEQRVRTYLKTLIDQFGEPPQLHFKRFPPLGKAILD
jgi:hypothetical protein